MEINAQIYVHLTHCLVANTLQIYLQAAFTFTVGWTAACVSHAKFVLIANFVQDILLFLWWGSSLREASFPRHTNCELDVKKSSQHWNLYKSNIFLKIIQ